MSKDKKRERVSVGASGKGNRDGGGFMEAKDWREKVCYWRYARRSQ